MILNTREKHLETCLVIATALLVFWLIYEEKALIYAAVAVGVAGAFVPELARWLHFGWYKLSEVLGWISSRVLLTLVFFVFLLPVALLYRLFNKDTLQLKRGKTSCWKVRNHTYEDKDLRNVW